MHIIAIHAIINAINQRRLLLQITYLTTNIDTIDRIKKLSSKYSFSIRTEHSTFQNCKSLALAAEQRNDFLVVAQGYQAEYLQSLKLNIPIIQEVVTLSNMYHALYKARKQISKEKPCFLLYPSWELEPEIEKMLEEMYQVKLVGIKSTPDELFHNQVNCSRLLNIIEKASYDAIFVPFMYKDQVENLTIPIFFNGSIILSDECISLTLDQVEQIIHISHWKQALNARTEALVQHSYDAVFCLNGMGHITKWNQRAKSLLPFAPQAMEGKLFWELFDFSGKEQIKQSILQKTNLVGQMIEIQEMPYAINSYFFPESNEFIFHFSELQTYNQSAVRNTNAKSHGHLAKYHFDDIIGNSKFICRTKAYAKEFAGHNASILIYGESGTGKELFAQSIHNASLRKDGPFVAINCATIPAPLLESELFGYVRGAFTGAEKTGREGLFELANNGTVFLDEISELTYDAQVKLLRVLAEKSFMRVGDNTVRYTNTRVIAATNKNLMVLVEEGKFRADLYYRLNVLFFKVEPLRTHPEDIIPIFHHYFAQFCRQEGKYLTIENEALTVLSAYPWPGNIRQLRNFCERLVILSHESIVRADFVASELELAFMPTQDHATITMPAVPDEAGRIRDALLSCKGKRKAAAELLGIHPTTLWRKMKEYDIKF